ncbi:MAG: ABC transporter permease subunit [Acidimicrobiales bacterium]
MFASAFFHAFRQYRRAALAWSFALIALVVMYVSVYPSIHSSPSLVDLMDRLPQAYRSLFGVGSSGAFSSISGYLNTELFTFVGPLLMSTAAIALGSSGIAGDEVKGILEGLLANPVPRSRMVWLRALAMAVVVGVIALVTWLALVVSTSLISSQLSIGNSLFATLQLALMAALFGALAAAVGAATGHPGTSRAIAGGLAIVAFLVNGLGGLVHWLGVIRPVSPYYWYLGHDPLRQGLWIPGILLPLILSVALILVGAALFERRDLRL